MGNENERKRDPAENRETRRGGGPDEAKTGGGETNVGLTGTTAGAAGGQSAGSGSAIGGSGEDTRHVLTGDQENSGTFSGQPQSGTSAIAGNSSRADLGASGAGSPGGASSASEAEDAETGEGSGFIGTQGDEDSNDYLREDGNPDEGFAEQGRGAPAEGPPDGPEGSGERTANRDSDVEGISRR